MMNHFRRFLLRLDSEFFKSKKNYFLFSSLAALVLGGLSIGLDFLLPWQSWGMILRTILLIPLSISLYIIGYGLVSVYYSYKKENVKGWLPIRARFSPTWRNRFAAIALAVLFVLIYATSQQPGYTFTSALIASFGLGLLAFVRKTTHEIQREELNLPDARDAALSSHIVQRAAAKAERPAEKTDKKAQARIDKARKALEAAEADLEKKKRK